MKVEVLYFDGCPSYEALMPRLRELMAATGVEAPVELRHVESVEVAERERFLGSPTLRVNGQDVDPTAGERTDFGLKCRLYPGADGLRGTVPDEFVVEALTQAGNAPVADADGFDAFARALQSTFPARDDAPLALALLRLLSHGEPASVVALAQATARTHADVVGRLASWPNVERDHDGDVVAFSGLTLRRTAHEFTVGTRRLHTWCAWDTLFLPALLRETAKVRSTCPVTGTIVELVVAPDGVMSALPGDLRVSFPPPGVTDTNDITGSFCCHVVFLAGAAAARTWRQTRADDLVFDVDAAYELGRRAVTAVLEPGFSTDMQVSR